MERRAFIAMLRSPLLAVSLTIRAIVYWQFGLFHGLWRYSSSRDLVSLIKAATLSSALIAAAWAFTASGLFPRSIFILDYAFSIMVIGGLRLGIRTIHEVTLQGATPTSSRPSTP